jgi:tRNA (mo5U34)-methyltransferase
MPESLYLTGRLLAKTSRMARAASVRLDELSRRALTASRSVAVAPGSEEIIWYHSIDLGDSQITRGAKSAETLEVETQRLNLPDTLEGAHVLDIGAWDGYFSFEMERRGAASVTALDSYSWSTDRPRYLKYKSSVTPPEVLLPPDESGCWDPVGLPGRAGFDKAREALNSRVKPVVGDFMTIDLDRLGQFDIVLFLGVLYHLKDPFLALKRLRQITRDVVVIETGVAVLPGWSEERLWLFIEGSELGGDASNWWLPTPTGLLAMCRAAGFTDLQVIAQPAEYDPPNPGYRLHFGRMVLHAHTSEVSRFA